MSNAWDANTSIANRVGEIAASFGKRAAYPALDAWAHRFQARPAYKRAVEKGGPYRFSAAEKWR